MNNTETIFQQTLSVICTQYQQQIVLILEINPFTFKGIWLYYLNDK